MCGAAHAARTAWCGVEPPRRTVHPVYTLFNTRNVQPGTFAPFWLLWRSGVELCPDMRCCKVGKFRCKIA